MVGQAKARKVTGVILKMVHGRIVGRALLFAGPPLTGETILHWVHLYFPIYLLCLEYVT